MEIIPPLCSISFYSTLQRLFLCAEQRSFMWSFVAELIEDAA